MRTWTTRTRVAPALAGSGVARNARASSAVTATETSSTSRCALARAETLVAVRSSDPVRSDRGWLGASRNQSASSSAGSSKRAHAASEAARAITSPSGTNSRQSADGRPASTAPPGADDMPQPDSLAPIANSINSSTARNSSARPWRKRSSNVIASIGSASWPRSSAPRHSPKSNDATDTPVDGESGSCSASASMSSVSVAGASEPDSRRSTAAASRRTTASYCSLATRTREWRGGARGRTIHK